jgi:HK97 family phage major capsid protein
MPSRKFLELQDTFARKQDELAQLLAQNRNGDGSYGVSIEEANRRDAELDQLHQELKALQAMEDMEERHAKASEERHQLAGRMVHPVPSGGGAPQGVSHESLGALVGKALQAHQRQGRKHLDQEFPVDINGWLGIEQKATMLTTSGWLPEVRRVPRIAEKIAAPIEVLDLFPTESVDTGGAVAYMEETTSTNAAVEIAEAGEYPESALAFTPRTVNIRKIGTRVPASDEQLSDVPGIMTFIDGRMRYFIRKRLDTQLLQGDGIAPNLLGIMNTPSVQTQAKGADPSPDAVYKAMNKVRVTGESNPTAVLFHPNDWVDIALLRTTAGQYIWGDPSSVGPFRIWGVPVVLTTACTEGTAVVVDTTHTQLYLRQEAQVEVGWIETQFAFGLQTIRASIRAGLAVYRAQAICLVTGL